MESINIGDGALVALFNAISLMVVAYFQYKTKKDVQETQKEVKENTEVTKHNSDKLDDAAVKVEEAKDRVEAVHKLANGRVNRLMEEIAAVKLENERLKAEIGHRRSTDA